MRAWLILCLTALALAACGRSQHDFATAEEAAQALVSAARADDSGALLKLLGREAGPLIESGDAVQDKNARERFVKEFEASHSLEPGNEGGMTLAVGADKWPFPFPLIEEGGRWRFDEAAGLEEIVNRRVGENELSTIQSCLAFVDAQREYYRRNPSGDPLLQYAQRFLSTEGKKDGLYWPTSGEEPPSPLGENFAAARSEGYFEEGAPRDQPFHGYVYRLLTAQGPNAQGGAYDYIVHDRMMGGFALLAIPAEYGASGVMTFMVNHDGVVYSRDLGPETATVAAEIDVFDPDQSWTREASIADQ